MEIFEIRYNLPLTTNFTNEQIKYFYFYSSTSKLEVEINLRKCFLIYKKIQPFKPPFKRLCLHGEAGEKKLRSRNLLNIKPLPISKLLIKFLH